MDFFENKYLKYKNKYLKLKNEMTGAGRFTLVSSAFNNGDNIPPKYTCEGDDIIPPLEWSNIPDKTKSFALIMEDPQAPKGVWDHLIIWNIDSKINKLNNENIDRFVIGRNSWGKNKYGGPCPPKTDTEHLYIFKLYSLDIFLDTPSGADKQKLLKAMMGHILAEARIVGLFGRR